MTPSSLEALLSSLLDVSVAAFAVTSMLSVGVGHRLRDVVAPLRNGRGVLRALAANFVFVPAARREVRAALPRGGGAAPELGAARGTGAPVTAAVERRWTTWQ